MPIKRLPTPNFDGGRKGDRPRGIVVHTTDGSFAAAAAWFGKARSKVSAHYLVGLDGRVAQFVDEKNSARHAGRKIRATAGLVEGIGNPNLITIGIEFEDGGDPAGVERTDAQYAAGAELVARAAARWRIPLDRNHIVGHREINDSKTCPGNLDVDRLIAEARRGTAEARPASAESSQIVCLLPVRNGEGDLERWLAEAPAWCDAVVALDDGSTDATREILAADPLVKAVLGNPRRESALGWHDGHNRNRLLETAAPLSAGWIISVDSDERIPADDAAAMREFLSTDALPGIAYGFRHLRLWGDDRFDAQPMWVYRLFAFSPEYRFPNEQLHFNPVPADIPRGAWVRTTLRVLHDGASNDAKMNVRAAKYREADPDGRYRTDFGGLDSVPEAAGLAPLRSRDASEPVMAPVDDQLGPRPIFDDDDAGERPLLAVLLPARNAANDLPGWLDSVSPFADAIVALDDGSTDGTSKILQRDSRVSVLLEHQRRPGFAGWNDSANRSELLEAAAQLRPKWILWLDADERIDRPDAAALREFLENEAEPGSAYGFRVFRMVGDEEHWDRADLVAFRLFAFEPGLKLPGERLHFVPVPVSIPRRRYVATTLRIKHLASLTADRRTERFEKYREADPNKEFQPSYEHLLDPPAETTVWEKRPAGLPVVPKSQLEQEEDAFDLDAPVLSVVVIARDDERRIERTLRSIVHQECDGPFEVIAVVSGTDRTAKIVRERFPRITLVELDRPAFPGEARNAGLAVARGDYVSFPGSHVVLAAGSLAARIRAHETGYPMITGTTLNLTDTAAGWASYFIDHSSVLPGRPSGELTVPPSHCSYDRGLLLSVGGFPEGLRAGEDTVVNLKLSTMGCRAYREKGAVLYHDSPCRTPWKLVKHHFARGRGYGKILLGRAGPGEPALSGDLFEKTLIGYVPARVRGTSRNIRRWGTDAMKRRYPSVRPLIAAAVLASWLGTWVELMKEPRKLL